MAIIEMPNNELQDLVGDLLSLSLQSSPKTIQPHEGAIVDALQSLYPRDTTRKVIEIDGNGSCPIRDATLVRNVQQNERSLIAGFLNNFTPEVAQCITEQFIEKLSSSARIERFYQFQLDASTHDGPTPESFSVPQGRDPLSIIQRISTELTDDTPLTKALLSSVGALEKSLQLEPYRAMELCVIGLRTLLQESTGECTSAALELLESTLPSWGQEVAQRGQLTALKTNLMKWAKEEILQLKKGEETSNAFIALSAKDKELFLEAYHLQERPYTKAELISAQKLLEEDKTFTQSLKILHLALVEYAHREVAREGNSRLLGDLRHAFPLPTERHQEKIMAPINPLDEIFELHGVRGVKFYTDNQFSKALLFTAKSRFGQILSKNYIPAIIHARNQLDVEQDTKQLLQRAAQLVKVDFGLFQSYVGAFRDCPYTKQSYLQAIIPNQCPAMGALSRILIDCLPAVYNVVRNDLKD